MRLNLGTIPPRGVQVIMHYFPVSPDGNVKKVENADGKTKLSAMLEKNSEALGIKKLTRAERKRWEIMPTYVLGDLKSVSITKDMECVVLFG